MKLETALSEAFLPRTATSAAPVAIWIAAAAVSVAAATVVSMQPGFLADLWLVRDWLRHWAAGSNPYPAYSNLDYPPNAFIVLAPLLWLGDTGAAIATVAFSVIATAIGTWLLCRWVGERFGVVMTKRHELILVLMMLAGGSIRGSIWRGQLAPLALLLGATALHFARRRPVLSAIALGLCAFKPHVALGFALMILVTEGAAIAIGGGMVALLLAWLASVPTGVPGAEMWSGYIGNLAGLYGGADRVYGLLSLRWVIESFAGTYELGTYLYVAIALCTAAILIDAALKTSDVRRRTKVAAGLMLWTVLFLPHQLYHGWMAAPAGWLMMWPESGLIENGRARLIAVSVYISFGVIDIPRLIRLFVDANANQSLAWLSYALSPFRLTLLLALLLWVLVRRQRQEAVRQFQASTGPDRR